MAMREPLSNKTVMEKTLFSLILKGCSILDIGTGIKPFTRFNYNPHVCIEPHWEYVKELQANGFLVIQDTAINALYNIKDFDLIIFLDVIEHMEKEEGFTCLDLAKKIAKQIIVFTPLGFEPQECNGPVDPWGFKGHYWQKHRSGWWPRDFEGFKVLVDDHYHALGRGAIAAVWDKR